MKKPLGLKDIRKKLKELDALEARMQAVQASGLLASTWEAVARKADRYADSMRRLAGALARGEDGRDVENLQTLRGMCEVQITILARLIESEHVSLAPTVERRQ